MEQLRLTVKIHDDHFKRDEEDRVWLRSVGERGWVILTKDQRLRYRPLELTALRDSRARVFVLVAGNLRGSEIAAAFMAACRGSIASSTNTLAPSSRELRRLVE